MAVDGTLGLPRRSRCVQPERGAVHAGGEDRRRVACSSENGSGRIQARDRGWTIDERDPEMGLVGQGRSHLRRVVRGHDHDSGSRIFDQRPIVLVGQHRRHGNRDRSHPHRSPEECEERRRVGEDEHHPLFREDADVAQRGRRSTGINRHLGPRQPRAGNGIDHGELSRIGARSLQHELLDSVAGRLRHVAPDLPGRSRLRGSIVVCASGRCRLDWFG